MTALRESSAGVLNRVRAEILMNTGVSLSIMCGGAGRLAPTLYEREGPLYDQ